MLQVLFYNMSECIQYGVILWHRFTRNVIPNVILQEDQDYSRQRTTLHYVTQKLSCSSSCSCSLTVRPYSLLLSTAVWGHYHFVSTHWTCFCLNISSNRHVCNFYDCFLVALMVSKESVVPNSTLHLLHLLNRVMLNPSPAICGKRSTQLMYEVYWSCAIPFSLSLTLVNNFQLHPNLNTELVGLFYLFLSLIFNTFWYFFYEIWNGYVPDKRNILNV